MRKPTAEYLALYARQDPYDARILDVLEEIAFAPLTVPPEDYRLAAGNHPIFARHGNTVCLLPGASIAMSHRFLRLEPSNSRVKQRCDLPQSRRTMRHSATHGTMH